MRVSDWSSDVCSSDLLLVQASEPDWSKTGNMQTRMKLPSLKMHKRLLKPNFIGSTIGIFEGCMPGAGGTIASFMSYNEARRWSKHPEALDRKSTRLNSSH